VSAGNIESFPSLRDVNVLRDFASTRNLNGTQNYHTKIFISRRYGPSRNSREIYFESLAKESNFQVLYFENISLMDQIAIFSNASVIVASNGAVFANLVWCKAQTNVYNIYSHEWDTDSVRDLCILLDLNYRKVHYSNVGNMFKGLR
jgi:capsular polysaccharide biosynthesis protein